MKLYELTDNYLEIERIFEDAEDEDILQVLIDTFDSIQDTIEQKAENIVYLIKNLDAEFEALKKEEEYFKKRKKSAETKRDNLKDYLESQLIKIGKDKISAGKFTVARQKSPASVKIVDETKIPEQYRLPQPDKIVNKAILDDLKAGVEIEGAILVNDNKHLRIK